MDKRGRIAQRWGAVWLLLTGLVTALAGGPVANAQQPDRRQPVGRFLTDTIRIGLPFQYSLSLRHSTRQDVLFPDTARDFRPFLVRSIAVFPTRTDATGSLDSAVYTLVSFDVASVQTLSVPVLLANAADCTTLRSSVDTVFLRSSLPAALPDATLPLRTQTDIRPLQQQLNYPYLLLAMLGAALAIGLLYVLFGNVLRRQWGLYGLSRRHLAFISEYNRLMRNITSDTAADTANRAVIRWKRYLERLEREPFTTMTTRELAERIADERLLDALREADQLIYGGTFSEKSQPALRVLRDIATQTYRRHRNALRQPEGGSPAGAPAAAQPTTPA